MDDLCLPCITLTPGEKLEEEMVRQYNNRGTGDESYKTSTYM